VAASVYSRTLTKAAELVGGRAKLCRLLKVPSGDLENWITDKAVPPTAIFLKAVDLIISETPAPSGDDSPPEPGAPRDCAAGESEASRY
jgi:hypothetical protein